MASFKSQLSDPFSTHRAQVVPGSPLLRGRKRQENTSFGRPAPQDGTFE